ncbi:MAG: ribbon-helix-helix protein, CopG family [Oscillospiraceae bacterium]|nr:ribbon-helix-helix protein, CopG family [Oscillospiraceae bacterium]
MAQIKQNIRQLSIMIDRDLYDLLDQMAQQTGQPKSTIIETYLSRGMSGWYEEFEPDSPLYITYKETLRKKTI